MVEVKNRPRMRSEYVDQIKNLSKYALAVSPVMQRGASLSFDDKDGLKYLGRTRSIWKLLVQIFSKEDFSQK